VVVPVVEAVLTIVSYSELPICVPLSQFLLVMVELVVVPWPTPPLSPIMQAIVVQLEVYLLLVQKELHHKVMSWLAVVQVGTEELGKM
jgi:hypothetical protein